MLEVIRQLQHRAHQDFECLLAFILPVIGDEIGQRHHFLGEHRGTVLLDHHQHAVDHAEAVLDLLQKLLILLFDVLFEIDLDLGQVIVDRFLDPAECGVRDRGLLGIHHRLLLGRFRFQAERGQVFAGLRHGLRGSDAGKLEAGYRLLHFLDHVGQFADRL